MDSINNPPSHLDVDMGDDELPVSNPAEARPNSDQNNSTPAYSDEIEKEAAHEGGDIGGNSGEGPALLDSSGGALLPISTSSNDQDMNNGDISNASSSNLAIPDFEPDQNSPTRPQNTNSSEVSANMDNIV
mmetsp:Transcript_17441/g.26862  ORF Transcript_17441/g.26862 Transcript_17441/m.26862 type:complete len:131 (+) Transcript_17441:40-432(+)